MTPPNPVPLMVAPFDLEPLLQPDQAPKGRGRHAAKTRRKFWTVWRAVLAVFLVVVLAAAAVVVVRLRAPAASASVTPTLRSNVKVVAFPVKLPWAGVGESAVSVPSLGITANSGPEAPVPIASITKIMTAYVIFHDHPLAPGQNGPNITITPADVADYETDTDSDEANAALVNGEVLTERQMLEGMLVHSANDFADALAMWNAGSIPAFVAKMNQTAARLGMLHTHYADASGYSTASESTAADVLIVAARDMANPTFASIVQMTSVTLPVAGTVSTYTPFLGFIGVIGVKSGFTSAAGGCDVMAVVRVVHGVKVVILAAVTGQTGVNQPNVLQAAGGVALGLVDTVTTSLGSTSVVRAGTTVAHVTVEDHTVDAVAQSTVTILTWPGLTFTRVLEATHSVSAGAHRGADVGFVVVALGNRRIMVPVRLNRGLPKETLRQRLL